ncbi:hypothetical protein PIB30_040855 [Stylosanthes scabra]|uniref:Uncharacterized protein n=1 Tax=Stylosanthes scabra TaxID=79078 RepID=A0ABU6QE98_9FABA|nr:hypothetical protein [Stylosanthes scabra]
MVEDEENEESDGETEEEDFIDDEEHMSRRGRAALSSEHTPSPSPTTSTLGTSQVTPTIPPATTAPSPQPTATDAQQVAASPQLNADSSHASQPDPPAQQVVQIPITWDGQKGEGFTWPEAQSKQIRKPFDYRAGRHYQKIMRDLRGGELQRLKWMSGTLRKLLLDRFANDPGFKKHQASSKANWASSKGGCLHTGVLRPFRRLMLTRPFDRPPTDAKVFRATHTRKRDRSIVEKRPDDLLPPNRLRKRVMRVLPQLTLTLCGVRLCLSHARTGFTGPVDISPHHSTDPTMEVSSASAPSTHTGPVAPEVMDLREQVQNLTQSLET